MSEFDMEAYIKMERLSGLSRRYERVRIDPVWDHDCESCTHLHTLMSPQGRWADFYMCGRQDWPSWIIRLSNEPSDNYTPAGFADFCERTGEFMEDDLISKWEEWNDGDPEYLIPKLPEEVKQDLEGE